MKKNIIMILGSCIFLGLSWLLFLQVPASSHAHGDYDSVSYLQRALIFYKDTSFAGLGVFPNLFVLGYPFFLGLCFKIAGVNIHAIILIQVLLALLCGFLMFVLARRFWNETVALITFLLFSCNLGFLVFGQFLLAEILLVLFLLLFVERWSAYVIYGRMLYLVLAGLYLGCSILIKPVALYYIFFLLPLFFYKGHGQWLKKSMQALVFLGCFYVPIFSYMVHNKILFNEFRLNDTTRVNIYYHFFSRVLTRLHGGDLSTSKKMIAQVEQQRGMVGVKDFFIKTICSHPGVALKEWTINVVKTFAGLYVTNLKVLVNADIRGGDVSYFKISGSYFSRGLKYITRGAHRMWIKIVGVFEVGWSLMRYIFCGIGFFYLVSRRSWLMFYFFSSYIFYFSLITGFDGCARYRMFFECMLIMLAALGIYVLMRRKEVFPL